MPQWPAGWKRTPHPRRAHFDPDLTIAAAIQDVIAEARRLGAGNLRIDTDLRLRNDGLPYSQQRRPDDEGAVVYFTLPGGKQVAMPCDKWTRVEHNLRAIARTLEAKRAIERWGCATMDAEYQGYQQLPASTEGSTAEDPYAVLGINPTAGLDVVDAAYKALALKAHPDRPGGSEDAMRRLNAARDAIHKERNP